MRTKRYIDAVDVDMAKAIAYRIAGSRDSDVESAAMEGLLKAAQTWDRAKADWITHALRNIRWAVLSEVRKNHPEPIDVSTLPDDTRIVGVATTNETLLRLRDALNDLDGDELLDGVDMRRKRHQWIVAELRAVMS